MLRQFRPPLRQCVRSVYTTPPRYSDIDWKSPIRTLGIRNPYSLAAGGLALTFFITFPLWFRQPIPTNTTPSQNDNLPAPVRGSKEGAIVESGPPPPSIQNATVTRSSIDLPIPPTENFPEALEVEGERFKLVAWGVRTVSFLRVQVYNVGLYVPESQYAVLPTFGLSSVDSDPWPAMIRIYSYPLLIRIIPVRNTDYAHLRDGLIKSTVARLTKHPENDQSKVAVDDSILKFKALFPKGKLKKGEVLTIMQKGPELKLFTGVDMHENLGGVKNDDLARGMMSAYLVGENVVSPDLKRKLKQKVLQIAEAHRDPVVESLKKSI